MFQDASGCSGMLLDAVAVLNNVSDGSNSRKCPEAVLGRLHGYGFYTGSTRVLHGLCTGFTRALYGFYMGLT